ncbi:hypothetical protein Gpo141_00008868 [Globisporangium polare]
MGCEKDKEIAYLRGQLAAYASMSPPSVQAANPFAESLGKALSGFAGSAAVVVQSSVAWGAIKSNSELDFGAPKASAPRLAAPARPDFAPSPTRTTFGAAPSRLLFGSPVAPAPPFGTQPAVVSPQRFEAIGVDNSQGGGFSIGVAPPTQPPTARQILKARVHKQKQARAKSLEEARVKSEEEALGKLIEDVRVKTVEDARKTCPRWELTPAALPPRRILKAKLNSNKQHCEKLQHSV